MRLQGYLCFVSCHYIQCSKWAVLVHRTGTFIFEFFGVHSFFLAHGTSEDESPLPPELFPTGTFFPLQALTIFNELLFSLNMLWCIWYAGHTQTHTQSKIYPESQWTDWTSSSFPCSSRGWDRPASPLQFTCIQTESSYERLLHKNTAALQYYNTRDRQREREKKEMRETGRTQKVDLRFWLNIEQHKAKAKEKTTITLLLQSRATYTFANA